MLLVPLLLLLLLLVPPPPPTLVVFVVVVVTFLYDFTSSFLWRFFLMQRGLFLLPGSVQPKEWREKKVWWTCRILSNKITLKSNARPSCSFCLFYSFSFYLTRNSNHDQYFIAHNKHAIESCKSKQPSSFFLLLLLRCWVLLRKTHSKYNKRIEYIYICGFLAINSHIFFSPNTYTHTWFLSLFNLNQYKIGLFVFVFRYHHTE